MATGVETVPADLSGLLNLIGDDAHRRGQLSGDSWTFAGDNNYNATNGTVHDVIAKANANDRRRPVPRHLRRQPHTATGTATGVESPSPVDLAGLLNLGGTTHTNAGDYPTDPWTFAGNGNYNPASGTVHE